MRYHIAYPVETRHSVAVNHGARLHGFSCQSCLGNASKSGDGGYPSPFPVNSRSITRFRIQLTLLCMFRLLSVRCVCKDYYFTGSNWLVGASPLVRSLSLQVYL